MSRPAIRCALACLALAIGLTLAAPNAEAAEGAATEEAGAWSLALRWVAQWEEKMVRVWETQGWQLDPNGNHSTAPPEGPVDPNS